MQNLTIISGFLSKKKIQVFDDIKYIRPFPKTSIIKIFTFIGYKIIEANILDLFSGSGVCSFEGLSRGAQKVCFVDNNIRIVQNLHYNVKNLSLINHANIYYASVVQIIKILYKIKKKYNIIFIDPPYNIRFNKIFWKMLKNIVKPKYFIIYRTNKIYPNLHFQNCITIDKNIFCFTSEKWDLNP